MSYPDAMINPAGHGGPPWLRRLFLAPAALWMVAQTHLGSFVGAWSDNGHWPGNVCWLAICYCLGHLMLGWGMAWLRDRQLPGDALFLAAMAGIFQLSWIVMVAAAVPLAWAGLFVFLLQPFMVIAGLAVVHRSRVSAR